MPTVASEPEGEEPARIGFGDRASPSGEDGVVSNSAILLAGGAGAAVLAMVYSSACARWLMPSGFADVTTALSVAAFLTIPTWPLDVAITRHAAQVFGAGQRALLGAAMQRAIGPAVKGSALCVLFWLAISPVVRSWLALESLALLALVGIYAAGAYVACVPRSMLRGDHRFRSFAANQVLEAIARAGVGVLLLATGFGAAGAIAGYVAGIFAAFAFGLWQLRDLPRDQGAAPRLEGDSSIGPVLAFHLYILFCTHADMLTAKRVLSAHDAGLYGAASTLSRALYLVAIPVYQVLLSRSAALSAAGEPTWPLVRRGLLLLCVLLIASCAVPFALGPLCLQLVYGASFAGALGPLRALWLGVALMSIQASIAYVLIGTNRAKGFWTLVVPCAVLSGLLATHNDGAGQVALSVLGGAIVGLLWCCGLAWIGSRGAATAGTPRAGLG